MTDIDARWRMLIDGDWVDAGQRREVVNPTTGMPFASVPEADAGHVDRALAAARRAQPEWGRRAPI
jgi:acyl-CoA reductase-like NAD-dependent aldehyde dehydrogenase